MTLQDIIADIHALNEDLEVYERKYGVLSETFYELYVSGAEPDKEFIYTLQQNFPAIKSSSLVVIIPLM